MKILLVFLLIVIPVYSFASATVSGNTVKRAHVNLGSGIFFQTNQAMVNPDGCAGSAWYHLRPSSKYEKEGLSVLLSAKLSGKKVQFYLNGCANGYPAVDYINIYD